MIYTKFNLNAETLKNSKSDLGRIEKTILQKIDKWEFRFWAKGEDRKYYEKYVYPTTGINEGRDNSIEICLRATRTDCKLFKAVKSRIDSLNEDLELIEKYIKDADENGNKSVDIPVHELNCKNVSTIDEIIHPNGFEIDIDCDDFKHIHVKW
jgi:hypothetical protein